MLFLIERLENRKAQVYDMPRVLKRIPGILAKERKTASVVNSRAPRPSPPQCIVDPKADRRAVLLSKSWTPASIWL